MGVILNIVELVNESKQFDDANLPSLAEAIQAQADEFEDAWGIKIATVALLKDAQGNNPPPTPGSGVLILTDDVHGGANYLGIHFVDLKATPVGYVNVSLCKQYGQDPSIAASHERLEMGADPFGNFFAMDAQQRAWILEDADWVNGEHYYSGVQYPNGDGIGVSNFVYRAAFVPNAKPPYSHVQALGGDSQLTAPFTFGQNGYGSYLSGGAWTNVMGSKVPEPLWYPDATSRRMRRMQKSLRAQGRFGALFFPKSRRVTLDRHLQEVSAMNKKGVLL